MKFSPIIFVFYLLFPSVICAQNYQPMVVENANYIYKEYSEYAISYNGYRISEDTIIDNKVYNKLHFLEIEIEQNYLTYTLGTTIGYLREEDQKVYFKFETSNESIHLEAFIELGTVLNCIQYSSIEDELLLYDYSVSIGDTAYPCTDFPDVIVLDTFSLNIIGQSFFGYETSSIHYATVIGSIHDLLSYPNYLIVTPYYSRTLIGYCVSEDLGCVLGPLSTSDTDIVEAIFPNPFDDFITLQLKNPDEIEQVRIYDVRGQLLMEIDQFSQEVKVDLSDIVYTGLFTLWVANKNGDTQSTMILKR